MSFTALTDNDVLLGVRDVVAKGKIVWTHHVEDQMVARGFDKAQIKSCLKSGRFTERPTISNKSGPVAYVFRMESIVDGQLLAVAASLVPGEKVIVITVFGPH